ncbi:hypothetical protein LRAMOSA02451 [Lichtheimia ramosa]|uniref:Uncharacterized protein n=1 Tax=Lichtheimia ramosa TaxID=688394 RepID=A0A077WRG2_9FUNG|nr:hypothetical protein LRAMOSA02451 [Lichtheimia ramosa]
MSTVSQFMLVSIATKAQDDLFSTYEPGIIAEHHLIIQEYRSIQEFTGILGCLISNHQAVTKAGDVTTKSLSSWTTGCIY